MNTMVLNFGMPRSGTTYMQHVIRQGCGFLAVKLPERAPIHPVNSPTGLRDLCLSMPYTNIVMVRTTRSLDAIKASAAHMGESDQWWALRSLDEAHETEQANVDAQQQKGWPANASILSFDYDSFGYDESVSALVNWLASRTGKDNAALNKERWNAYIASTWMKVPVRPGRLSQRLEGHE